MMKMTVHLKETMNYELDRAGSSSGSSGTTVLSDTLADSMSSVTVSEFSLLKALDGKSYKARLGGDCGVEDDWYIVLTVPTYEDTGKVFVLHNTKIFCQAGAGAVKMRVGVTDDYDTAEGSAITAYNFNTVLHEGNPSELVGYQYIGTEADGLPSDLGTATMFGEVGNFGLCENNIDGISKANPMVLTNGYTYIIQVSNEYYQQQRITIDFDWWELDGDYFSDDFLENLS